MVVEPNQTKPFFRSEPGPLAGYPDPLLTLHPYNFQNLPQVPNSYIGGCSQPTGLDSVTSGSVVLSRESDRLLTPPNRGR